MYQSSTPVLDVTAAQFATLVGFEEVILGASATVSSLRMTGTQADAFTAMTFSATGQTLILTSTSADLNLYADDALTGLSAITAAAASGSVTIDLQGQSEAFALTGGGFADSLIGGSGNDTVQGGAGADTMNGGGGSDMLDYQSSAAKVTVNLASFVAIGGDAAGDVFSNFENIRGSSWSDVLTGSAGANVIEGGGGKDVITGAAGADLLFGGDGAGDRVSYARSFLGVTVDLNRILQSGGDAEGDQITGFENITGSSKADILIGNAVKNTLTGGGGANFLFGGSGGVDILSGGDGNDTLDGGSGPDLLSGGAGADQFILSFAGGDTITDFVSGADVLRVSASAFGGGLAAGVLDPSLFLASSLGQATDALQRFLYDTTTGELFFDADGTGAAAQRLIATLSSADPLLASDFLIV